MVCKGQSFLNWLYLCSMSSQEWDIRHMSINMALDGNISQISGMICFQNHWHSCVNTKTDDMSYHRQSGRQNRLFHFDRRFVSSLDNWAINCYGLLRLWTDPSRERRDFWQHIKKKSVARTTQNSHWSNRYVVTLHHDKYMTNLIHWYIIIIL
jgi:hypothetical protein